MHSGKLNMLRNSIGYDFTFVGNCVNFNFLGILDKLRNYYRVLFRNFCSQGKEKIKFLPVGNHVHGCTRQHIRRTDQHRKTYYIHKIINLLYLHQFFPARLINF